MALDPVSMVAFIPLGDLVMALVEAFMVEVSDFHMAVLTADGMILFGLEVGAGVDLAHMV